MKKSQKDKVLKTKFTKTEQYTQHAKTPSTRKVEHRLTEIQKQYKKELTRIRRSINRLEKQGYYFDNNPMPDVKRATRKQIERLKEITGKTLKQKAQYVDTSTGEITSALEESKRRRSESAKKAWERRKKQDEEYYKTVAQSQESFEQYPFFEDIIISNFKLEAEQFPEIAGPMIVSWINSLIAQYGKSPVANMIQEGRENGLIVDYQIAYRKDLLTNFIGEMLDYLKIPEDEKRTIVDAFELDEDWETPE